MAGSRQAMFFSNLIAVNNRLLYILDILAGFLRGGFRSYIVPGPEFRGSRGTSEGILYQGLEDSSLEDAGSGSPEEAIS